MNADLLNELFVVDIDEGRLYWKKPPTNHSGLTGKEAGTPVPNGNGKLYIVIAIGRRRFKRGHLIFFLAHGRFPTPCLDHSNGNSLDDRICNLREATVIQNAWNHKKRKKRAMLPMGVKLTTSGRYEARIGYNRTQISLGSFDDPAEAHAIYMAKRKELFGEFA